MKFSTGPGAPELTAQWRLWDYRRGEKQLPGAEHPAIHRNDAVPGKETWLENR